MFLLIVCQLISPTFAAETEATASGPIKIGLALGGGGARGAAHVGVLRALEREGIQVDMVAGTSIGAIVGGLYCAGLSVDEIEAQFRTAKMMKSYMTVPVYVSIAARPIFLMPRLIGWRPFDGFYFGNKFRRYYESCLPENRREIEKLKIPFHAMTYDLAAGEPYSVDHGNLARAVQASSAIPVLRRPVLFGRDRLLCDGALLINVPVLDVKAMGADLVIAVPISERLAPAPVDQFRKVGSVGRRVEQVFLSHADKAQLEHADVVIHPHTDGISILSTDARDAKRAIEAGEEAAKLALPEIKLKIQAIRLSKAASAR